MKTTDPKKVFILNEVSVLLQKIDRTYAAERSATILALQNKIWDDPALQDDDLYFLQDLTGDLNFYEPFEPDRDIALGYYDDDRLLAITEAARKQIDLILA